MARPHCYHCNDELIPWRRYDFKTGAFKRAYSGRKVWYSPTCGLVQADMTKVDNGALSQYYQHAYRQVAKIGMEPEPLYTARGKALAALAQKHVSEPKTVFEVGAGHGYNLLAMRSAFPGIELYTDEPDNSISRDAAIKVRDLTDGPYDIVVMSHVLEHFTDPGAMVRKAIDSLSPNGRLIIEVPNDEHGVMPINGPDEPHLSFFQLRVLTDILAREGEVIAAYRCGPSNKKKTFARILRQHIGRLPILHDFLRSRRKEKAVEIDRSKPNPKGRYIRVVLGKDGAPRSTDPIEREWLN